MAHQEAERLRHTALTGPAAYAGGHEEVTTGPVYREGQRTGDSQVPLIRLPTYPIYSPTWEMRFYE